MTGRSRIIRLLSPPWWWEKHQVLSPFLGAGSGDIKMSELFEVRWQVARNMWEQGSTTSDIAKVYKLSPIAMKRRIQQFRKAHGWFPARI